MLVRGRLERRGDGRDGGDGGDEIAMTCGRDNADRTTLGSAQSAVQNGNLNPLAGARTSMASFYLPMEYLPIQTRSLPDSMVPYVSLPSCLQVLLDCPKCDCICKPNRSHMAHGTGVGVSKMTLVFDTGRHESTSGSPAKQ